MEELKALQSLGITLPSPAFIIGAILFSIIGIFAYYYGKRTARGEVKWIGVALMLYTYFVWNTLMMYVIGCLLCIGLYIYRE